MILKRQKYKLKQANGILSQLFRQLPKNLRCYEQKKATEKKRGRIGVLRFKLTGKQNNVVVLKSLVRFKQPSGCFLLFFLNFHFVLFFLFFL